jgi:hypothetical protein
MQWPARTTSVERWPQILPPLIGDQPVFSSPNQKASSSKSAYQVDPVQCTSWIGAGIVLHGETQNGNPASSINILAGDDESGPFDSMKSILSARARFSISFEKSLANDRNCDIG